MLFVTIATVISVIGFNYMLKYLVKSKEQQNQSQKQFHFLRRFQHTGTGIFILVLFLYLPDYISKISIFCGILFLLAIHGIRKSNQKLNELYLKQMKFLLRPYEIEQLPGAFYFLTGIFTSMIFFERQLSFCDPAASIIGIYYQGKQFMTGKSYAGTIGCGIVGSLVTLIPYFFFQELEIFRKQIQIAVFIISNFSISILSEIGPADREYFLDDNFTIPFYSSVLYTIFFKYILNI